jgi:hypothetical protein
MLRAATILIQNFAACQKTATNELIGRILFYELQDQRFAYG